MDRIRECMSSVLKTQTVDIGEVGLLPFVGLMAVSLLVSLLISYLYVVFYRDRATGSHIHRSFPLLGVSITAVFVAVQFSLPLSLGLLGALSIVRFRTPVKEPEEIGFLMLLIASAICCATFNLVFLGILLLGAFAGLLALRYGPKAISGRLDDGVIVVALPGDDRPARKKKVLDRLAQSIPKGHVESILENDDDTVISYSFPRTGMDELLAVQSGIEGDDESAKCSLFFNRRGDA